MTMATVARETVIRENLLIGGQRRPARSGRYFETVNPADERVIALVAEADVEQRHRCSREASAR